MGSPFHHGHVSRSPPIIPDSRFSRVRFGTLACLPWTFPVSMKFKRWFAYASTSMVCPQPRSVPYVGLSPALCPAAALAMKPPSVQSPFARRRRYRHRRGVYRLLRGHCSSVFARMDSSANPEWLSCASAAASLQESLQVATRPLLPPGSSRRYLCESFLRCLVPCRGGPTECTCLFLPPCHRPCPTGVWVGFPLQPANTTFHGASFEAADISLCSGLRVCSPPRSFLPLRLTTQGSRGFYVRAYRALLPPHAPDMLAARYRQLAASGLSPDQIRSLVGCSPLSTLRRRPRERLRRTRGRCGLLALQRMTLSFTTPRRFNRRTGENT